VVVVAVTQGAVGIDVEPLDGARPELAEVVLGPSERALLDAADDVDRPRALIAWWVRKEAVLKLSGIGLDQVDPADVTTSPPWQPPELLTWPGPGSGPTAQLVDLDIGPGYAACVAVETLGPVSVDLRQVSLSALRRP
jgi:4'-phosphopantetheinyl transferase